jgi:hypothetical protein
MALIAQVSASDLSFNGVDGETYTYSIDGRRLGYNPYGLSSYLPSIRILDDGTIETPPGSTSGLKIDYVRIAWTNYYLVLPGSPGSPPTYQSVSGYTYLDASSAWLDPGFSGGATLVGTSALQRSAREMPPQPSIRDSFLLATVGRSPGRRITS